MTELHVFESPDFRAVRTTEIDGKPYFCGADAANALWYAKPIRAFVNEDGKIVCVMRDVTNMVPGEETLIDENGNKHFEKYEAFVKLPIVGRLWEFYDEAQTKEAPTKVESVNIESTAVNDNPKIHTAREMKVINEYKNAVDENFVSYINKVKSGEYAGEYAVTETNRRTAQAMRELTGLSKVGEKIVANKDTITHIEKRRGANGKANKTMADINDIARLKYVIDNSDNAYLSCETTTAKRLSDGARAPKVIFSKKVNGTYLVVEAVSNSKSNTNLIVTAYFVNNESEIGKIKKEWDMSKAKSDNSQLADRRLKPLDPYSSTSTIPHSTPESQEKRVENSEINVSERENEVEKLKKLESEESIQADIERIDAENKNLEKELENNTDEPDTDESITVPMTTRAARYEIDEKTAKTVRDMRSMREYKAGEATRENQRDLQQFRTADYLNFQTGVRHNYTV